MTGLEPRLMRDAAGVFAAPQMADGHLHDDGLEAGCHCNRYVHHIEENGKLLEKGFGYSL